MGNSYRFEIFKDSLGEWRWHFKSANNEIMATSEGYKNRQDARSCIQTIRMYVAECDIVEMDD
jgi:uncharacterized protein YegP (UPF0339 family)